LLPRIIAVADTFDALTTNRPYQNAHDPQDALKIIHSLAGKRLDPNAVAALAAIYNRGEIRIKRPPVPVLTTEIALPTPAKPEADREHPADTAVAVETTRF
jgi:HD-GYP domain-containing protein (c-di-GMP phosphodiesterase class II)